MNLCTSWISSAFWCLYWYIAYFRGRWMWSINPQRSITNPIVTLREKGLIFTQEWKYWLWLLQIPPEVPYSFSQGQVHSRTNLDYGLPLGQPSRPLPGLFHTASTISFQILGKIAIEMSKTATELTAPAHCLGPEYRPEEQKPTATVSTKISYNNVHILPQTAQLIALLTYVFHPIT